MLVYNLRRARYADQLTASGVANRWNRAEEMVIYAGSTRSLAMLESLVHRNSSTIYNDSKMLVLQLEVAEEDILDISKEALPSQWPSLASYPITQQIGSAWYHSKKTIVLRIPSAVVPQEYNYLINTTHPDFNQKVRILRKEDFVWDSRLVNLQHE